MFGRLSRALQFTPVATGSVSFDDFYIHDCIVDQSLGGMSILLFLDMKLGQAARGPQGANKEGSRCLQKQTLDLFGARTVRRSPQVLTSGLILLRFLTTQHTMRLTSLGHQRTPTHGTRSHRAIELECTRTNVRVSLVILCEYPKFVPSILTQ